jgi:hypothetical protein
VYNRSRDNKEKHLIYSLIAFDISRPLATHGKKEFCDESLHEKFR